MTVLSAGTDDALDVSSITQERAYIDHLVQAVGRGTSVVSPGTIFNDGGDGMCRHSVLRSLLAVFLAQIVVSPCIAQQQLTIQPTQGQSAHQLESDKAACSTSATQSSGYNPAQATTTPPAAQPQMGGRVKGAMAWKKTPPGMDWTATPEPQN